MTTKLKAIALRLERHGWRQIAADYFGGYATVTWKKGNRIVRYVRKDGDARSYVTVRHA